MRRHAAALLGGAAAVHFAILLFDAGMALGVSGFAHGRALVLWIAVVPAVLLFRAMWDARVGCWAFLLGACAGHAADEWILLPRLGYGVASAGWAAVWLAAWLPSRPARRLDPAGPPARKSFGPLVMGAVLGTWAGFVFAAVRPFLFQHVAGTRHGLRIAVAGALLGILSGAALGQVLKRRMPTRGLVLLCAALSVAGAFATFQVIPKASAGVLVPYFSGGWTLSWLGRSILGTWALLGLPAVAIGVGLPAVDRRQALPFLLLGLGAGTMVAERGIGLLGGDPAAFRAVAERVARHPPLQRIEAAGINPDGMWVKYRTRTLLDLESVGFYQGTRVGRGALWGNLQAAEVERAAGESSPENVVGSFDGNDRPEWIEAVHEPMPVVPPGKAGEDGTGYPFPRGERFGGANWVLTSSSYLASGFSLRDAVGGLDRFAAKARKGGGRLRAWCDPRALSPAGVRSLLATWRQALPDATFSVLVDGYGGPLLGVSASARVSRFPLAEQLTVFSAPVSSALRGDLGPPSTFDRPVLEWEASPEPSPFPHPSAPVMRALLDALAVEPGSARGRLLRGLVIHAEAQVARSTVVSAWDHVAIPEAEVREYMMALAIDDRFEPLVRHLEIVFEVLLRKREYALLVRHLEEAVARRPDNFAFHRTLGKAYADILDFQNAIEELTQARAIRPDHHEIVLELSRALGGASRWPEAVALLEAEQKRNPDAPVKKGLALALLEVGEIDRARQMIKELWAVFPADPDVMQAQDRIDQLSRR